MPNLWAQRGCDEVPIGNIGADSGCLLCPPYADVVGGTFGYTPSLIEDDVWCSTIENDQFFLVFADDAGALSFDFTTDINCGIEALQVGLYQIDPLRQIPNCQGAVGAGQTVTLQTRGYANQLFMIRIDGNAGAECEFTMHFNNFGYGSYTQYTPIYVSTTFTELFLDRISCATCFYTYTYRIVPEGAGDVLGNTPNGLSNQFIFNWTSTAPVRAIVEEIGTLLPNSSDPNCPRTSRKEIFTHFLDQSNVLLLQDTTLDCSTDRHTFLLPPKSTRRILLLDADAQRYLVASAGVPTGTIGYRMLQDDILLRNALLTSRNFADTVSAAAGAGPVILEVSNEHAYDVELLVQRLTGVGRPYSFIPANLPEPVEVCQGTSSVAVSYQFSNPNPAPGFVQDCAALDRLDNPRLTDASGLTVPGTQVTATLRGWSVDWRVSFDATRLPAPGEYHVRGSAVIPRGCTGLGCIDVTPVDLDLPLLITAPRDTLRLPEVTLGASGGAILFVGDTLLQPRTVLAPGVYTQIARCTLYIQRAVTAPTVVDLGDRLLCPGTCLTTPTNETFGCAAGPASLLASNDTTYLANVRFDTVDTLALVSTSYECDTLAGEWAVVLTWSGSRGPWFVNGRFTATNFFVFGPVREPTTTVTIMGASPCVAPLELVLAQACVSTSLRESAQDLGLELLDNPGAALYTRIGEGAWQLSVSDALGRRVFSAEAQAGAQVWSATSDLPAGTYLVDFRQNQRFATLKWVKP